MIVLSDRWVLTGLLKSTSTKMYTSQKEKKIIFKKKNDPKVIQRVTYQYYFLSRPTVIQATTPDTFAVDNRQRPDTSRVTATCYALDSR